MSELEQEFDRAMAALDKQAPRFSEAAQALRARKGVPAAMLGVQISLLMNTTTVATRILRDLEQPALGAALIANCSSLFTTLQELHGVAASDVKVLMGLLRSDAEEISKARKNS